MAAIKYNLPPSLELKGNVAENFRRWKLLFNNYMLASKQNKLKDEEKLPLLFNMAGHEVILKQERILQGLTEEEKKDYGLVMKALQKYCTSQGATNEVFERFVFHQRNQEPGEPFDHFYDEIQDLVKTCNYKEPSKELRDRIVQGILDKTLQETFLKTRDLTEELVVQACRAAESARLQVQKMNAPEVHHLSPEKSKKNGGNGGKGGKKNNNEPPSKVKDEEKKADDDQKPKYKFKCWACDTIHPKFKCPAWGQTCDNCKKKNHLTKQCRYEISVDEIRVQVDKEKQEIEEMFVLEELEVQETYRTKFLPGQKKEWREMVIIEGQPVYAKLDPGSEVNVLPVQVFEKMNKPLRPGPRLSLYGGKHVIATLGSAVLEVESRDQTFYLEFLVVQNGTPLLGIEDSERLNLVRRVHHVEVCKEEQENFLEANKDIFTGTGKFPGELTLCVEDGKIKQSVPHRLPNSINKKLKPQLDLMEKNGIITKVKEIKPTMVINNLVVFEKSDGSLRILKYSFKITYRPGKQMYLADHFSRTYLEETEAEDPEMGACVHSLSLLPVTDQKLQDIKNATKEDGTLRLIMQYVMNGWPKHYSELPADCKPYWQHRPDLHVQDGLLLKEKKIVLPSSLRREIMAKLHAGHAGRDKTIARARLSLYWPNYTEDIEAFVAECHTCAKFRPRLSKPEMMPHEIPLLVWNKLGMDLMKYGGQEYLVLMDYFSKWLEIVPVTDKRAVTIVSVLSQIFATHGYPATIICDNVPFNAYELQKYAAGKFDIITTSPTYASSNGLAESAVNIAKQIMKKADEDKKPYGELLREYRATPISGYEFSPAQILFSRQIKTEVPCMEELLQPKLVQEDLHKLMSAKKKLIKEKHDAKVKRSEIQYVPGESVLIRNRHEKVWTPGEVVSAHTTPRSYWVKKPNGVLVRRNEAHIQRKPVGRPAVIPHPLQTPDPAAADFKTSSMPELIPIDEIPEEEQDTSGQEENLSEFVLVLPDHYFDL
ncbi:hypothetical protein KUF71_026150 [Frankliniella fusca]|uniref:RNA-directed DNA polymerase n=1 Tax=Frankliniella fusca TaxID=407009 RepID=A0AAE1H9M7_9NEOP|nr:hypothetical protein KUF71_026150 [Frankliniella fusca]